jgi:hypothetical protein
MSRLGRKADSNFGGAHVVIQRAERLPEHRAEAPPDLMVDDIDAAHRDYVEEGLGASGLRVCRWLSPRL